MSKNEINLKKKRASLTTNKIKSAEKEQNLKIKLFQKLKKMTESQIF